MELRQLQYFVTVANVKNLSKAAQVLYISQPALSKSIAALERELGVDLFDRRNKKMTLTGYGQVFHRRILRLVKDLDSAVAEIRQMSGQTTSVITFSTFMPEFFTPISVSFHRENPDIILREFGNYPLSPKEALVFGDINFSLTPIAYDHPSLAWFSLKEEEMLLIAPRDMDLSAKGDQINLADLEAVPFVSTLGGTNLHQCTTSFCKAAGFNPQISIEAPSIDTITMLVAEGCGVAFLSETVHETMSKPRMNPDYSPYQVYHVVDFPCLRNVGIAVQRDHVLTSPEYSFLLHLLFFFQPEMKDNLAMLEGHTFYRYLQNHYHRVEASRP